RVLLVDPRHEHFQLGQLSRRRSGAGIQSDVGRAIVETLSVEHSGVDRSSAAGERQEGDRDVRLLDGERERGTDLVAVKRPMARGAHPARAVVRPVLRGNVVRRSALAGSVAGKAGATRPIILSAAEAPEAEAALKLDRLVGIALTRRNGIAEPGNKQVAHVYFGRDALRRAVTKRNVDRRNRGMPGAHPHFDFRIARRADWLKRSAAVVERPRASLALRDRARYGDADRMVTRIQVVLISAVAVAGLQQVAVIVEAQIADDVLGPADAAIGCLQPPFLGEYPVAAACRHLVQEIRLLAEQPEAILHLPYDVEIAGIG